MSVRVQLPSVLREYTAGLREIETHAATVAEALDFVTSAYPVLRRHLFADDGSLRGYVRVYLNSDDIGDTAGGIDTALSDGDILLVVPSIAGGAPDAHAAGDMAAGELTRYARHLALPGVGMEGQQRLRAGRVLVVGAGGLGSPALLYLAAAGVGTIGIVDDDVVDLTNLQRQVLYGTSDIGRRKTEAAAARVRDINPHVAVHTYDSRITRYNAMDIIADYDIVIDGTDNFPTRYLVNDACVMLGRPYVYGSILRFEGQVSVFTGRTGPCYRCLFREPPPPGLVPSCAEGGVLGVLPGIIGSMQALQALTLLIGSGEPLIGRLALFDALSFQWRELRLRRNPGCPVCGDEPTVTALIDYDEFCGLGGHDMNQQPVSEITVAELKERLDNGEKLTIIDVREPFEWDIANLSDYGAQLIPLDQVVDRRAEIPNDREVIVHCRSGARSAGAIRQLRAHGYEHLVNLKGGIKGWAEDIDPSMATY